jgi:hypothetical protein
MKYNPLHYNVETKVRFNANNLDTVPEEIARPLCSRVYTDDESRRFLLFADSDDEMFNLVFDRDSDEDERERQFDVDILPRNDEYISAIKDDEDVEIVHLQTEGGVEFLRSVQRVMEEHKAHYGLLDAEVLRGALARHDAGPSEFKVGDIVSYVLPGSSDEARHESRVEEVLFPFLTFRGNPPGHVYAVRPDLRKPRVCLSGDALRLVLPATQPAPCGASKIEEE